MRIKFLQTLSLSVGLFMLGCGSEDPAPLTSGGTNGGSAGGNSTANGGSSGSSIAASGGNNTSATGGVVATGNGGSGNTGTATGGVAVIGGSGNTATGGAASGGKAAGGAATGGTAPGGAGVATGGKATGGVATGGAATGGGASTVNCSGSPLSGGTTYTANGSGNVGSTGYHYELWRDGSSGSMTVFGVGAAFKAAWNNSGDFLARVGLKWNETQTYDQYGTVAADYAYTKTGTGGGYSFIGIYGWSTSPLVEYYIVDDWFGTSPPTGGGTLKGSFDVDGGTYKIYTYTRVNMPSIKGTQTFPQFFSVRQTARQCGHISITEHFKKWASLGLYLGKMYECKILLEAGGGTGTIDFTTAAVTAK